ncbi:MAG: tetratricopeptide repeat protein [Candidatus Polarisedimenticolaceae bacterium]|nr:tetratricopeptide repeat protein [Candidatus Polarisedimenticolaceae bacterium]
MRVSVGWVIFMVLLLVAGCSATQQTRFAPVEEAIQPPVTPDSAQQKVIPERRLVEKNSDAQVFALSESKPLEMQMISAIDSLTEQAEQQRRRGDLQDAVTTLERALRIEPRNPHLWNRLAQLYLQQKQFKQAGDLAARSNALTEKGAPIRHDNWHIIAAVRRIERDYVGAKEAENRAATLQ